MSNNKENIEYEDYIYEDLKNQIEAGVLNKTRASIIYLYKKIISYQKKDMDCFISANSIADKFGINLSSFLKAVNKTNIVRQGVNGERKRKWVIGGQIHHPRWSNTPPIGGQIHHPRVVKDTTPTRVLKNDSNESFINKDPDPGTPGKNQNKKLSLLSEKNYQEEPQVFKRENQPPKSPPAPLPLETRETRETTESVEPQEPLTVTPDSLKEVQYPIDDSCYTCIKKNASTGYQRRLLNELAKSKSKITQYHPITTKIAIKIWEKVLNDNNFPYKEKKMTSIINKYKDSLKGYRVIDFIDSCIQCLKDKSVKTDACNLKYLNDRDFFSSIPIDYMLENNITIDDDSAWLDMASELTQSIKKHERPYDMSSLEKRVYKVKEGMKPWDA